MRVRNRFPVDIIVRSTYTYVREDYKYLEITEKVEG